MSRLRWLSIPTILLLLTGFEAESLDGCLAETTVECALEQASLSAREIAVPYQRAAAYSYIARVQADAGFYGSVRENLTKVKLLRRELMEPALHDGIMANEARVRAMIGDFDQALELAEAIGNPVAAVRAWAWVAEYQADVGRQADANRSLERALSAARNLGEEEMAFPMAMMAIVRVHQKAYEDGLAAADVAMALTFEFDEPIWQVRVASLVAVAEAEAGAQERSRHTIRRAVESMERLVGAGAAPERHMSALAYIAWARTLTGDKAGAGKDLDLLKRLVEGFPDHFWRSIYLSAIALVVANGG